MDINSTNLNKQLAIREKAAVYRDMLITMGVSKLHAALLPRHIIVALIEATFFEKQHLRSNEEKECFDSEIKYLLRGVVAASFSDLPYKWAVSTRQIAGLIREFPCRRYMMYHTQAHIANILEGDLSYRNMR
jgi:hypothetical protein